MRTICDWISNIIDYIFHSETSRYDEYESNSISFEGYYDDEEDV